MSLLQENLSNASVQKSRLLAGVVLYQPDKTAWDNVAALLELGLDVVLVDNSLMAVPPEKRPSGILQYVHNGNRGGLAGALNILGRIADKGNYDWLLSMDQDSSFGSQDQWKRLWVCACSADSHIAVVAPRICFEGLNDVPQAFTAGHAVRRVMTSGMLLRVAAWRQCGEYREDFFIDSLDNEYCLRLQDKGWGVWECGEVELYHHLGNMRKHRAVFSNYTRLVSHHSPLRRYYMIRNRVVTLRLYGTRFPDFVDEECINMRAEFWKVLVHEQQRLAKLRAWVRGWVDGWCGVLGPWQSISCCTFVIRLGKALVTRGRSGSLRR